MGLRKSHAAGLFMLVCSAAAQAHTDLGTASGLLTGFMHPLFGLDHLLAMVAVGIWGATLGRPLVWAVPVAFPMLMVVGGMLGISGVPLPYVETGIAVAVVVLGLAIAAALRAPVGVALAIVALFGVFHGFAHGTELPGTARSHRASSLRRRFRDLDQLAAPGRHWGLLKAVPRGLQILRAGGGLIAAAGGWILAGMFGVA